jgi:CheY-like chemotaxis protein
MNSKQLNILLADDDEDDRYFFDKALKELPISSNLTILPDGEKLMNYLSGNSGHLPDVLFLDINMPRKNGIECLSEIKHSKKLKDIPVVMFSTSNSWDTISQLFKSGAHVYIHKPGDFTQLKEVIYHALPIASEKTYSTSQVKYIFNA